MDWKSYKNKAYSKEQYAVIERALESGMEEQDIDIFADPMLSSDLMEELRFCLKDGLSKEQTLQIKESCTEQWQMDFMRYGLQNNLTFEQLVPIVQNPTYNSKEDWTMKRNQIDKLKQESLNKRTKKENGKTSVLDKLEAIKAQIEAHRGKVDSRTTESIRTEQR